MRFTWCSHPCPPELGRQPSRGLSTTRSCRRTFPKSLQPESRTGERSRGRGALRSDAKRSKVGAGIVQVHSPPPLNTRHPPRQYPGGESRWTPATWRAREEGAPHSAARQLAVLASSREEVTAPHSPPSRLSSGFSLSVGR